MVFTNYKIRRIVDNGSLTYILYFSTTFKLTLVGFSSDKVYPLGYISLTLTVGTSPKQITKIIYLLVVYLQRIT